MTTWAPEGPYIFQDGKRKGKALEVLMFTNYPFLVWLMRKIKKEWRGGKKNALHLHLEWLLERGEDRRPTMLCPQCQARPVRYFSIIYIYSRDGDFSIGAEYTCCEEGNCQDRLLFLGLDKSTQLLPFRFSVLGNRQRTDQRRLVQLFKTVFGLPERLSRSRAFEFFSTQS